MPVDAPRVAGGEARRLGDEILWPAAAAPHEAVAEDVLLKMTAVSAVSTRLPSTASDLWRQFQRIGPRRDRREVRECVVAEHMPHAVARAFAQSAITTRLRAACSEDVLGHCSNTLRPLARSAAIAPALVAASISGPASGSPNGVSRASAEALSRRAIRPARGEPVRRQRPIGRS